MCGIAGLLRKNIDRQDIDGPLHAMKLALQHRGPDDAGIWQSPSGSAAFAHTRLSILDLSAAGHQPMSTADGRFTITFNGEIYNFLELRRVLGQTGVNFHTQTDTEVILRAYEAYGPACVENLRGMFAFALWDEKERTCLLARDRFGIKPLYYHVADEQLRFASEVRALLASNIVPRELDPQGVYDYFRTGSVPEPNTLLREVRCLEAGHYAFWQDGRLAPRRYWELRFTPEGTSEHDSVIAVRAALRDSVAHHFISDVPVGVFLSGGIDSTALVALANAAGQRDLHTFSISFPGSPNDEGDVARRTAKHFGTRHDEWPLDAAAGKELFKQFLLSADQPSIDGLNTFTVSKFAHERGMKVVLSGLGGDELFGGYKSFRDVPRLAAWNRRMRWTGPLRRGLGSAFAHSSRPQWRRLGDMLGQTAGLVSGYEALRGIYTHTEACTLTAKYAGTIPVDSMANYCADSSRDVSEADTVSRLELTRYMRNQLLRDADVMSMAWGLELRVPFLDAGLVNTLARVPAALRIQAGKRFLLQAVPEVPDWVANQPKRGFMFPFEQWLGGEWREMFAAIDGTCPVPTQTWYRKWCVFALDRWLEKL